MVKIDSNEIGCDYCVIPKNYKSATFDVDKEGKNVCCYCKNHVRKKFKGLKQLKTDINLGDDEKVGVMVSGGKDGLYAWLTLCDLFGSDKVIAFNHHKSGLVHQYAYENLISASKLLNSKLVIVNDDDFIKRFKKNLEAFLKNPDPAMVRVALCAGCRYGITGNLYSVAEEKFKINKFVSAASYLELAPFKAELLKEKGKGNDKYGLLKGLVENDLYNFENNIEVILNEDRLSYKSMSGNEKMISKEFTKYKLFDLDDYLENDPLKYEKTVVEKLNWKRPEKSWHFDCIVEDFKDFFYYGSLGYTENEFNLSQMIRYDLITRENAIVNINTYKEKASKSLNNILEILDSLQLSHLKEQFIVFFEKSKYFRL